MVLLAFALIGGQAPSQSNTEFVLRTLLETPCMADGVKPGSERHSKLVEGFDQIAKLSDSDILVGIKEYELIPGSMKLDPWNSKVYALNRYLFNIPAVEFQPGSNRSYAYPWIEGPAGGLLFVGTEFYPTTIQPYNPAEDFVKLQTKYGRRKPSRLRLP